MLLFVFVTLFLGHIHPAPVPDPPAYISIDFETNDFFRLPSEECYVETTGWHECVCPLKRFDDDDENENYVKCKEYFRVSSSEFIQLLPKFEQQCGGGNYTGYGVCEHPSQCKPDTTTSISHCVCEGMDRHLCEKGLATTTPLSSAATVVSEQISSATKDASAIITDGVTSDVSQTMMDTSTPIILTEVFLTTNNKNIYTTEIPTTEVLVTSVEVQITEIPATSVEVQTTEIPATSVEVQTTEIPATSVEVQTTEAPTTSVEVQTTEAPATSVEVQTTEAPATSVEVQTTEIPATSAEVQTTEAPTTSVEVQTTEAPATSVEVQTTEAQATSILITEFQSTLPPTSTSPTKLLKLGDTCGGLNHQGNGQCEPTLRCTVQSEWTSKCLCPNGGWWCEGAPGYITSTTITSTTSTSNSPQTLASSTTTTSTNLLKLGDTCGGLNHQGNGQCEPTLRCTVQSEWTSKCLCPNGGWWCEGAPGYITSSTITTTTTTSTLDLTTTAIISTNTTAIIDPSTTDVLDSNTTTFIDSNTTDALYSSTTTAPIFTTNDVQEENIIKTEIVSATTTVITDVTEEPETNDLQATCKYCGALTTFADVCSNCVLTRKTCKLRCSCNTTPNNQNTLLDLSDYPNNGCHVGMNSNQQPYCHTTPLDCSDPNIKIVGVFPIRYE